MSTRRNVFMAKLFGGYKSIFSFHVNHIHINFQVPWVELDMNYGDTFLFIISRANFLVHIDDAHSAVNKRCFLAYGPRKKKKSKKEQKSCGIHTWFLFSALLICNSISTLCYALTAMANIQNSYECPCHYTTMFTFFPFLSWRIAEAF